MDEKQVQLLDAEGLHGLIEAAQRGVAFVRAVAELGRDEEGAALDAALSDRLADAGLVAIALRRIEGPVTGPDGIAKNARAIGRWYLPGAEPQLWHHVAVAQRDLRNAMVHRHPPMTEASLAAGAPSIKVPTRSHAPAGGPRDLPALRRAVSPRPSP